MILNNSKAQVLSLLILCVLLFVSGCFAMPIEDPPMMPPVVHVPETQYLRTAPVMRGDVVRIANLIANYVPAHEERLTFDIGGMRIMGIYVNLGDTVSEGDIIATLYRPEITSQLESAKRRYEWLQLDISHLRRRRNAGAVTHSHFSSEMSMLEKELDLLQMELEYLTRENDRRYLRAGMDGTISQVMHFTEGMVSHVLASVATVADLSYSIFMVRLFFDELYMDVGDVFTLLLNTEPFLVVVIDPDEFGVDRAGGWGREVFLTFYDVAPIVPAMPFANIHAVLEKSENTLHIPLRALHRASERTFVYVLTEDGLRVLRDVEVGLRGNTGYEILSGLYEGEMVILG